MREWDSRNHSLEDPLVLVGSLGFRGLFSSGFRSVVEALPVAPVTYSLKVKIL